MEQNLSQSTGQRALALLLLWLCGACLRLTVLALPPVVPLLHADLHLSETAIGWLSSLAPLLFAIVAVPGALLIARFGVVAALLMGLVLNAAGSAARGAWPEVVRSGISLRKHVATNPTVAIAAAIRKAAEKA